MNYLYISLLFVAILQIACKTDNGVQQTSIEAEQSITKKSKSEVTQPEASERVIQTDVIEKNMFSDFLEMVEAEYCADYSDRLTECYKMNALSIKTDFLGKLPITLNFPYKDTIPWHKFSTAKNFEGLWSNKCGFVDKKTGTILKYHCPNLNAEAGTLLDDLASKGNALINAFNIEYKKTQDFSQSMQSTMILEADNGLDFENTDHRTFYWLYHMSLSELRQADTKFKNIINKVAAEKK